MEKRSEAMKKAVFWITVLILLVVSFLIIKPYLISLMSAFILAYLVKPLHERFNRYMKKSTSALICLILIVILILIPLSIIGSKVIGQIDYAKEIIINVPSNLQSFLSNYPSLSGIDLNSLKDKGTALLLSLVTLTVSYIPSILISLLITFLGAYYILVYWKEITFQLKQLLPFKNKDRMEKEISNTTTSIIHGYFFVAIIEFMFSAIGFFISGVGLYIFFPMIIGIFAFVPLLGAATVWIPLAIYYIAIKSYTTAIGVIITGGIISFFIDRIVAAKIMQKTAKINPLVFIVGILGGVPLLGVFGLVIGPLILTYTLKFIKNAIENR